MSASEPSDEILERTFGEYAAAARQALGLAARAAESSWNDGRIPIAGAAVHRAANGSLRTVALGVNGRIPLRESEASIGYPSDHGETAAIRNAGDLRGVDWSATVFATTLSPCVMCSRALSELYERGLRRLVIAEASSFAGERSQLEGLPGMQIALLDDAPLRARMQAFARTYPWDWQADIGAIPPREPRRVIELLADSELRSRLLRELRALGTGAGARAGLWNEDGWVVRAEDERENFGGNPCFAAPMLAMGRAGSTVLISEQVLVYLSGMATEEITVAELGLASLGACELFRPAVLLADKSLAGGLRAPLEAADVEVLC